MEHLAVAPPFAVMGVLNVTPDSFSDGGEYLAVDAAVERGLVMARQGASIVDIGGESTRPGAERVEPETELARVVPVVRALVAEGVAVSVDTSRASVAVAAVEAGAGYVNDVSGGLADANMARVVADAGCPWVLMHWRGHSDQMQRRALYGDVVAEVRDELRSRVDAALAAGVAEERIVLDPGLGFAKLSEHNWTLLARLPELVALGFPLLVGASRKSFLGALLADADGPRSPSERDAATLAITLAAHRAGAWGVRVHDVRSTVDALTAVRAIEEAA